MSLQLVANHLAQKGRGPDSNLVHMSNREVAGLQALAKRHGGSLSVNPDTGLPEAGFLDSILPTIAGAGLAYFGMNPMMAGALVGGVTALDSKDLSKGLMAGLGAWGGAGLTEGLMGVGASQLGGAAAAQQTAAEQLADAGAGRGAYIPDDAIARAATPSNFDKLGAGAGQLFSNPGQTMTAIGGGSPWKAAGVLGAAAAPIIADEMVETTTEAPPQDRGKIRPYTYSRQQTYAPQGYQAPQENIGSKERRWFNDSYTAGDPYSAAGGGLVALASGGYTNQNIFRPTTPLPANNMYGASRDAYDYLMGVNPTSGGGQSRPYDPNRPFPPGMQPSIPENGMQPDPNTPKTGKGRYEFDPVTRQYKWIPDPITPVDVAAPVFENPMQSGGGGGMDAEGREARQKEINERMDKLRETLGEEGYAKRNDWIGKLLPAVLPLGFLNMFKGIPLGDTSPLPVDQEGNPITEPFGQFTTSASEGTLGESAAQIAASNAKAAETYAPPQGDPAQQKEAQQAQDARVAAFDASRESSRGGGGGGMGGDNGGRGVNPGGYSNSMTRSGDNAGGSMAAHGGYLQHGQFDQRMAHGGIANLHQYNLGSYSDGGRLLKGPGDGVSDDIPATIGHGQPARLADGEFVIPARIVSELGNGSTDAGARELYKMMDRIQAGRRKTVGKDQVAKNSKSVRHLPA